MRPLRQAAQKLRIATTDDIDVDTKEEIPTVSVDLPSAGVFNNGVKAIRVSRTLSVNQIRALYGLRGMQSAYNKQRELINIIGRSIQGINFLDMTWEDFRYVMYWLRLNTYKPSPYAIQWEYTPAGSKEVKTVTSRVSISDYKIIELDRHKTYPYVYETVRMRLESLELESEDDKWFATFACSYARGDTLAEKMELLDRRESDVLTEIRAFQKETLHGLFPTVQLSDPENLAAGTFAYELVLETEDFFPS